jgi:hypothetical protein
MKFDEFKEKLQEYKEEYKITHKKELATIKELEDFLKQKKYLTSKRRRHLTSLKGFNI